MQKLAGDPLEDPVLGVAILALILVTMLFVLGLGVGYVGDEFVRPAWSERSVPAPRLY